MPRQPLGRGAASFKRVLDSPIAIPKELKLELLGTRGRALVLNVELRGFGNRDPFAGKLNAEGPTALDCAR